MIDSVGQIFLTEALILYRFVACDNVYCRVTSSDLKGQYRIVRGWPLSLSLCNSLPGLQNICSKTTVYKACVILLSEI